jgi:hypothetical protein
MPPKHSSTPYKFGQKENGCLFAHAMPPHHVPVSTSSLTPYFSSHTERPAHLFRALAGLSRVKIHELAVESEALFLPPYAVLAV